MPAAKGHHCADCAPEACGLAGGGKGAVCQTSLSMGFSRQEYWSGLPCPHPGDLPNSRIKPASLMSPALAGWFLITSATWEAHSPV